MKSHATSTNPRLDLRLAAYAAAGIALAAPAMSSTAKADVVYSGALALPVPQNGFGIYLDLTTGATAAASFTGYDVNFYGSTNLTFYYGSTGTTVEAATTTGVPLALTAGTSIGPTSIFSTSGTTTNFRTVGTEFLGVKFINDTTLVSNYGWIQLQTGSTTTGYPATILGYAFDNTGGAILAGQTSAVPEPGTTAAMSLGALALGAVGVRRMRQKQAA